MKTNSKNALAQALLPVHEVRAWEESLLLGKLLFEQDVILDTLRPHRVPRNAV